MSIRNLLYTQAISQAALSAGLAAYQKGQVHGLDVQKSRHRDTGQRLLDAYAEVGDNRPEIHLIGEDLSYAICNCAEGDMDHLCRHGVALLRALSDHVTPERQIDEGERAKVVENLLNAYAGNFSNAGERRDDGQVCLLPILDFDPYSQRFALSFRIGREGRSYVLKNLSEFANRIRNQEVYRYGKWLQFRHERCQFDDNSQFFIDFISSAVSLMNYGRQLHLTGLGTGVKRYLYLTSAQFDHLFEHTARNNGSILCQIGSAEPTPLQLTFANPGGQIEIATRPGNRYSLSFHFDDYQIYRGDRHRYLYTQNIMIRPEASYQRAVLPLVETVIGAENHELILTEDELTAFIATAEPHLQPYVTIDIDPHLHNRLIPPELNIHLRLDYPWPNTIRGILTYSYGAVSFNPLAEPEDLPAYRHLQKEINYLDRLYHYRFSQNEDELLLLGEEELFHFLQNGLSELMPLSEIDIEDRLAAVKPRQATAPRMSASMSHGLIELQFDESTYPKEELVAILDAYQQNKSFIRLSDDTFLNVVNPEIAQLNALLEDVGLRPNALLRDQIEIEPYRASHLMTYGENSLFQLDINANLKQLAQRLNQPEKRQAPLPQGLKAILRPYQITGYQWFVNLSELHMGGILADDMGLGKTVQTIAYLLHRNEINPEGHSLIVVPTSLIYNWQEELERFAPGLSYRLISGNAEERRELLREIAPGTLLITSYATLRRDSSYYEQMYFDSIIADEAQYIKNSYTQNARSLKSLNADYRFALTGTPMENALADLWSILDFCMPGYLHGWSAFRNIYEIPIAKHGDEERLERLRKQVAPFLLRRVKKDVLAELPDKIETTLYAELSGEESRIYQSQLALSQKTFIDALEDQSNHRSRIKILALLMRLRQVCCSPALFLDGYQQLSAKLRLALDLIRERHSAGHQMILFSQFTSMLDLIAKELDQLDIPYLMLTGQTHSNERMQLVNRFQSEGFPIFLISLKAGGVGLNLTAADTVIHYDPWWNQSVENQATDRTHRIGQKQTVHVIRLICKNTIEEKIMSLKAKKADLANTVVGESQSFFGSLTEEDLKDLFNIPPSDKNLREKQIQ